MKYLTLLFVCISLCSCRESKWEETKGDGVPIGGETLNKVIYFENYSKGLIGGYKLMEDANSNNMDKLETIPVLYLTKNGGGDWKPILFDKNIKGSIDAVLLSGDTITCRIDSITLRSIDLGVNWKALEKANNLKIRDPYKKVVAGTLKFKDEDYRIKEWYRHTSTIVVVCKKNGGSLTDYYFVSRNNGKDWDFLQQDYGSNKSKFLLKDQYLISYDPPYGLQRLKLK
jgi:hypothetical protein